MTRDERRKGQTNEWRKGRKRRQEGRKKRKEGRKKRKGKIREI